LKTVVLVGSLDTKGDEYGYAANRIRALGATTILVDTSTGGEPTLSPDVSAAEVARAGGEELDEARRAGRPSLQETMIRGATVVVKRLRAENRLDAVFALGGSNNTSTAAAVFRTLPVGVPKLILTTMASGSVGHLVGPSDLMLAASVVDVAGLNHISRTVIANAAAAVAGMALAGGVPADNGAKPLVACSMIGLTTTAVTAGRRRLEELGYEVVVFHMTGEGGRAMETLISSGSVAGVLDLTTSEVTDDLFGGVCSAGPDRLRAAAHLGVPQVIGPGGLDMINFGPPDTVPSRFAGRTTQIYNQAVTLVRTTAEESALVGTSLVERLAGGPATVVLPSGGFSAIDEPGQPWHDAGADEALRRAVRAGAGGTVRVIEVGGDLDRPHFGHAAAALLHDLIAAVPATRV
jgi:uncharacterized protein (UPF0261 family)